MIFLFSKHFQKFSPFSNLFFYFEILFLSDILCWAQQQLIVSIKERDWENRISVNQTNIFFFYRKKKKKKKTKHIENRTTKLNSVSVVDSCHIQCHLVWVYFKITCIAPPAFDFAHFDYRIDKYIHWITTSTTITKVIKAIENLSRFFHPFPQTHTQTRCCCSFSSSK